MRTPAQRRAFLVKVHTQLSAEAKDTKDTGTAYAIAHAADSVRNAIQFLDSDQRRQEAFRREEQQP